MRIIDLIQNRPSPFYSLEFFPPKDTSQYPEFFSQVEKLKVINPLFVSVTCGAGGSGQGNTVEIASHMKNKMGLECMAHCTCVRASKNSMEEYFQALKKEGIDNILALRGDKPKNEQGQVDESLIGTDFTFAKDLVLYAKEHYPEFGVGVAGYPAAHPESKSFGTDRICFMEKLRAGSDFAVTQLFFDSREYFDMMETLRSNGVECPVIPGILPIQSLPSLKHTLSLCGTSISGKFLMELEKAHEQGGTEKVKELGLKHAVEQIRMLLDAGAPGIHLYTLNRSALCLELIDMI